MMLLLDAAQRRTLPHGMSLKMVLPTDGKISTSVWESEDKDSLIQALDSLLSTFCETEVFEVVEEHIYSKGMDAKTGKANKTAGHNDSDSETNGLSKVTATTAAFASTSLEKIKS